MISNWLGHHHSAVDSPIHRLPAWIKLGSGLGIIVGSVIAPPHWQGWFISAGALLGVATLLSRIPPLFLLRRILLLSPFVLGVAVVNTVQPGARVDGVTLALRSFLCLLTVILVSNTTPFSHILSVLRAIRVPSLLISTLALMHRYLFVLADEAGRMQRARASRTFSNTRTVRWQVLSTVASQLFVRASNRAERIYDAMCARGWK